jgi:predicted transcriptional regulator
MWELQLWLRRKDGALERISEAEAVVLAVLWEASPLTALGVVEGVPAERRWSANTARTLLARLVATPT